MKTNQNRKDKQANKRTNKEKAQEAYTDAETHICIHRKPIEAKRKMLIYTNKRSVSSKNAPTKHCDRNKNKTPKNSEFILC